jgi:indole-3-glycerol phosphate synthase
MNILEKIIRKKHLEVALAKTQVTESDLKLLPAYGRKCLSLRDFILDPARNGIIAEFKRASPSKGIINGHSTPAEIAVAYQDSHVSAISVLTDADFFQGGLDDLAAVRQVSSVPVLRKEFVVDPYQITEAKAYGADIILLIASCLSPQEIEEFSRYAKSLGMSVLLEVHNAAELENNLFQDIDAIGVNNRNLGDFSVSVQHSLDLVDLIPDRYIKVSESGISDPQTIKVLKERGFQAFLIGENFMKSEDPASAVRDFVSRL